MAKIITQLLATVSIFTAILFYTAPSFAQGKYFVIKYISAKEAGGIARGDIDNVIGDAWIPLTFKGKSKRQLQKGVLQYIQAHPGFKLDKGDSTSSFIVYRDFANIGDAKTCMADLVGLTFINVVPEEGYITVRMGMTSKIFATIFDAKLLITPDDDVASIDDKPFNEYNIVQPGSGNSAYPDSIFNPKGKLVNPTNKKIIEEFLDGYVTDLKNYLDKI